MKSMARMVIYILYHNRFNICTKRNGAEAPFIKCLDYQVDHAIDSRPYL